MSSPRFSAASLKVAIAGGAIGIIYGYDTGNIGGALKFISQDFHLGTAASSTLATSVAVGLIIGALIGGRLADAIGRKLTLITVAASYVVFAVLSAVAFGIASLDVFRTLLGVSIGICIVATPLFLAESSPAASRGAVVSTFQLATVAGIMCAYFIDFALAGAGAWRIMLGLSAVPSVLVLVFLFRLRDTPRWYMLKERPSEARARMLAVDPGADPDHELAEIRRDIDSARGGRLAEMLRHPYRLALVFVLVLGFLVQITGINAITYYSPEIFGQMGFQGYFGTLILPGFVEVASLFATFLSLMIIDRAGRRVTLLSGIGVMVLANALMIALFSVGLHGGVLSYLGFVGILFFTAGFNFGFGCLVQIYASESFPARLRGTGATVMLVADLVGNLLIAQLFQTGLQTLGGIGMFAIFLGLAVFSFVWVAKLAPETKGRPLETIRRYWENGASWQGVDTQARETTEVADRQ
jgi:sugar porter (SP) family MFS transporter